MTAERRPGGWVDGIGWVAFYGSLSRGDIYKKQLDHRTAHEAGMGEWLFARYLPVIVTRWADGTTPTAPAPHVEDMPEWDALVEAVYGGVVLDKAIRAHALVRAWEATR